MAIFHLTVKVFSRGKGQSAIAAAAYRSGERLRDEQAQEQKFYQTRAERIQFTDIMAPAHAPEWVHDRNQLWNEAERAEKRKDAQLAREIEVSLPHELTDQQRQWLVKDFAREAFVRNGYAVDIAIHAPDGAADVRNHHAHLMVTMRRLEPEGFAGGKDRSFNTREQLTEWREQWAHLANRHLERHGHKERIDHRSHEARGIDREPTVHVGYAANEMAARGAQSDRMDALRTILDRNEIRLDIKAIEAELKTLESEQAKQQKREDAARAAEAERQHAAQKPTPAERPHVAIQADHAKAEAQRVPPTEQGRHERAQAQQDALRESVAARSPDKSKPVEKGLQVVDGATGVVSRLGDFVTDLLAGSSAPSQDKRPDMRAYVADPQARKEQQLARLAATRHAREEAAAIERIAQNLEKGKALDTQDIRKLSHQHQEQIRHFGDDGVRQMVDDARKLNERYWKGDGREREL